MFAFGAIFSAESTAQAASPLHVYLPTMFDNTLLSPQRNWLVVVWLAWALMLFGGWILGTPTAVAPQRMPVWTRMASSALLVVAAWSLALFARGTTAWHYALLVAAGMSFGLLGDLFMARLIPVGDRVLGGIGAFGLGHLFYVGAFLLLANRAGLDNARARWGALVAWWLVGLVGWYLAVYRGGQGGALQWPALVYALLLATTTGLATGLALQQHALVGLALGAALFLLSDLILAAQLFSGLDFRGIGDLVWLTYGPGQMLIVYSVAVALRLLR